MVSNTIGVKAGACVVLAPAFDISDKFHHDGSKTKVSPLTRVLVRLPVLRNGQAKCQSGVNP